MNRDVALKVLPVAFTADAPRMVRFRREARILASLNHPNIATIYGIEDGDGVPAIAMELVEGTTLAEVISGAAKGNGHGLPIDRLVDIAVQLAKALDAAHERGIIHRDLKPANVMLTRDGVVKVLDFGLAKVDDPPASDDHATAAATLSAEPTRPGMLMGTAAYMSPEQARGEVVDKRTDIWAFGCVLYEMLTGRPAFSGLTLPDIVVAVLERDIDWSLVPANSPAAITTLLRHCLAKDRRTRLRDIGDARLQLEEPLADGDRRSVVVTSKRHANALLAIGAGLLTIVIAGLWAFLSANRPASVWWSHSPIRIPVDPVGYPDQGQTPLALSADGSQLAWVAARQGKPATLWIQALAGGAPREIAGTEDASGPFWSSDGLHVGFFTPTKLNTVDVRTGLVTTVAEQGEVVSGGTWGADGTIVYSARYAILRVAASGGTPTTVAVLHPEFHENSLRYPHFLPDGHHFIYVARSGRPQESAAYVGGVDGTSTRLFPTSTEVSYTAPGYLVYGRDNVLVAQRFNAETFELGSEVTAIAPYRAGQTTGMDGNFAVAGGVLAYLQDPTSPSSELWWVDRSGRELQQLEASLPGATGNFRIAPDGTTVVVDVPSSTSTGRSVWVLKGKDQNPVRVTFEASDDWTPVWSHDGGSVFFMSYRNGVGDLFQRFLASGEEKPVLVSDIQKLPLQSSPDGRYLAYASSTREGSDIWAQPLAGGSPLPIATTKAGEFWCRFSPDGRYVAYGSDETGTLEVFVQPFPPAGRKWQITVGGGGPPKWSASGREIFFLRLDGQLMSVPVSVEGGNIVPRVPVRLFDIDRSQAPLPLEMFDVVGKGDRFLVRKFRSRRVQPISVILNWPELVTATQVRDTR